MPHSRIVSANDPRIKDSEKYKQWKKEKEKIIMENKKREKIRQEKEKKRREEEAEQRTLDYEYYAMVRDFEMLVERLVFEAVNKAERRKRQQEEQFRKAIAKEVMTNWESTKQEEKRAEKKNEKKNKLLREHLEKSALLEDLKDNHQRILKESWSFQKWFEKQIELREQNIIPFFKNVSSRRPKQERPASGIGKMVCMSCTCITPSEAGRSHSKSDNTG